MTGVSQPGRRSSNRKRVFRGATDCCLVLGVGDILSKKTRRRSAASERVYPITASLLGHRNIQNTTRYTPLAPDRFAIERKRRAPLRSGSGAQLRLSCHGSPPNRLSAAL